mmetsp:Transcript_49625/g.120364  ORF Transcript_49625/g.120364 Transcript_49625/m.120364 type:complete len:218 (-) Transcript_49625:163-816(-)
MQRAPPQQLQRRVPHHRIPCPEHSMGRLLSLCHHHFLQVWEPLPPSLVLIMKGEVLAVLVHLTNIRHWEPSRHGVLPSILGRPNALPELPDAPRLLRRVHCSRLLRALFSIGVDGSILWVGKELPARREHPHVGEVGRLDEKHLLFHAPHLLDPHHVVLAALPPLNHTVPPFNPYFPDGNSACSHPPHGIPIQKAWLPQICVDRRREKPPRLQHLGA